MTKMIMVMAFYFTCTLGKLGLDVKSFLYISFCLSEKLSNHDSQVIQSEFCDPLHPYYFCQRLLLVVEYVKEFHPKSLHKVIKCWTSRFLNYQQTDENLHLNELICIITVVFHE